MDVFFHKQEELPILHNVDVLVVGSGPAGCAAAIMSARSGAKTLLVDSGSAPGGISTIGMMSHYSGKVESKLYEEVLQRMADKNMGKRRGVRTVNIDPLNMVLTWIELLEEAGAGLLLYTMACESIVEDGRIAGIVVQNKTGRSVVLAKVVIDATGDGDIAADAGVGYCMGREKDGRMQPATLMFKVAGVDMERAVLPGSFETEVPTEKGELQALAKELLPHPAGHVLLYRSPIDGVVTVNMTNAINIDGTTAEGMTEAELVCRKQIPAIVDFLREYAPGYEKCYAVSAASLIGIRETRHLEGVYTITAEDILARHQFEDWIVRGAEFNFDVHNLTDASLDVTGVQKYFPKDTKYTIPYRCLLPKELEGLLFAGRNISGTHMAHSSYRVMPICLAMGEGAGVAAALAVKQDKRLRDLDVKEIQSYL